MSPCVICPGTALEGQQACRSCAEDLRGWLAELPQQARLLEEFVTPSAGPAQGRLGGTGRAHAPAPVDLRVLALLAPGHADAPAGEQPDVVPIRALLGAWAGHIAYHYPAVGRDAYGTAHTRPCDQAQPTADSITGWCNWLTGYLPFALTLPLVAELHDQLGDQLAEIRRLTHATPRDHPQGAPCPSCEAFALVRTDGRWGIHCRACGHDMDPEAYDQHAARFLHAHQAEQAA
ncbi:hypothetical protein AB0R01_14745 [Streptomyces rochei]|uniref:hypothetical protein n=1 Tax=Streptomyces rochei TaxID=1928 RepID=UPI00343B4DCB